MQFLLYDRATFARFVTKNLHSLFSTFHLGSSVRFSSYNGDGGTDNSSRRSGDRSGSGGLSGSMKSSNSARNNDRESDGGYRASSSNTGTNNDRDSRTSAHSSHFEH